MTNEPKELVRAVEFWEGEEVTESPVGPGTLTGMSQAGYPQVNNITVVWVVLAKGNRYFDPCGVYRRQQLGWPQGEAA